MQKTEEFIIKKFKWKAEKFGLPTEFAFYFDSLPSQIKNELAKQIDKENCGTPVLFFTKPTKEWTIICSQKVICNDNTRIVSLHLSDIKQIMPTAFDSTMIGKGLNINTVKKKIEWDTIKIINKQGNSNIFYADKGRDLFSLWNILLMAKRFYD